MRSNIQDDLDNIWLKLYGSKLKEKRVRVTVQDLGDNRPQKGGDKKFRPLGNIGSKVMQDKSWVTLNLNDLVDIYKIDSCVDRDYWKEHVLCTHGIKDTLICFDAGIHRNILDIIEWLISHGACVAIIEDERRAWHNLEAEDSTFHKDISMIYIAQEFGPDWEVTTENSKAGMWGKLKDILRKRRRSLLKVYTRKGYEWLLLEAEYQKRIEITSTCSDSLTIPKVANAGSVIHIDAGMYQVMHNGILVKYGGYYGKWMSKIIRELKGHHEPQEEKVFNYVLSYAARDGLMVEVGCYWAYYSMWYVKGDKRRSAIGIEPDSEHLKVGRTNVKLNKLEDQVDIREGIVGSNGNLFSKMVTESGRVAFIKEYSLAKLIQVNGRIEILHCDAQGAESSLVDLIIKEGLKGNIRFIFISTHSYEITKDPMLHYKVLDALVKAGCHIIAEHDVHESYSGDGLVVGSFDPHDKSLCCDITYNRYSRSITTHPAIWLAQAIQKEKEKVGDYFRGVDE